MKPSISEMRHLYALALNVKDSTYRKRNSFNIYPLMVSPSLRKTLRLSEKLKRNFFLKGIKSVLGGWRRRMMMMMVVQPLQGVPHWMRPTGKGPKGTITSVAVCFDGSKFTCGFEKCGMTFSRARDVQRHFKCAHPEHLKLENKDDRPNKERDSKSKGVKVETRQNKRAEGEARVLKSISTQGGWEGKQ